jgi:hypothetical protein
MQHWHTLSGECQRVPGAAADGHSVRVSRGFYSPGLDEPTAEVGEHLAIRWTSLQLFLFYQWKLDACAGVDSCGRC